MLQMNSRSSKQSRKDGLLKFSKCIFSTITFLLPLKKKKKKTFQVLLNQLYNYKYKNSTFFVLDPLI